MNFFSQLHTLLKYKSITHKDRKPFFEYWWFIWYVQHLIGWRYETLIRFIHFNAVIDVWRFHVFSWPVRSIEMAIKTLSTINVMTHCHIAPCDSLIVRILGYYIPLVCFIMTDSCLLHNDGQWHFSTIRSDETDCKQFADQQLLRLLV